MLLLENRIYHPTVNEESTFEQNIRLNLIVFPLLSSESSPEKFLSECDDIFLERDNAVDDAKPMNRGVAVFTK